ncbi:MAG: hypothetical protein AAF429_05300 [Pseudomonadota bacterium]
MNGIIRMIVRLVMIKGMRHGIDWFFKRRATKNAHDDMTPEERQTMKAQNRQQAQTTKRGFRVLKRFIRF